jgi:hypothetical protein
MDLIRRRGLFERSFSPTVGTLENADSYEVPCTLPKREVVKPRLLKVRTE